VNSVAHGRLIAQRVMVGLVLLEGGLPVLSDHHERRQEDGLERDHQGQGRPWALLEQEHPDREDRDVDVDEQHRSRIPGDVVGDGPLKLLRLLVKILCNGGMVGAWLGAVDRHSTRVAVDTGCG
jgi:hypothetical protein